LTNGGLAWGSPITIAKVSGSQFFDKDWIVCDDTATSPHYGNCYAEWDDAGSGNQLHMAFSTDGGLTWTRSTVPAAGVIAGQPLVQPNGNVVMPIDNASESSIESFVSTNGGSTYLGPFTISSVTTHTEADFLPGLAVDRTTSGATATLGLTCYFYPKTNCCTSTCRLDVGFVGSADGGSSWTSPTQLAADGVRRRDVRPGRDVHGRQRHFMQGADRGPQQRACRSRADAAGGDRADPQLPL
jgi:hypothetical protein